MDNLFLLEQTGSCKPASNLTWDSVTLENDGVFQLYRVFHWMLTASIQYWLFCFLQAWYCAISHFPNYPSMLPKQLWEDLSKLKPKERSLISKIHAYHLMIVSWPKQWWCIGEGAGHIIHRGWMERGYRLLCVSLHVNLQVFSSPKFSLPYSPRNRFPLPRSMSMVTITWQ